MTYFLGGILHGWQADDCKRSSWPAPIPVDDKGRAQTYTPRVMGGKTYWVVFGVSAESAHELARSVEP